MARSALAKAFTKAFGRPSPAAAPGLTFASPSLQYLWESIHGEIGAGWFRDGFLYLFGEGLEALLPCLDAWSFLLPRAKRPLVLGRNAYGALLVMLDSAATNARVGLLDPVRVAWTAAPGLDLGGLLATWLPEGRLPGFTDEEPYRAWRRAGGKRLGRDELLAPDVAVALGGTMEPAALRVHDAVAYYEATGPAYAKAGKARGGRRGGKGRAR